MADARTVLVTGASGLLGRAVARRFAERGWRVVGTAFSRAGDGLVQLDLRDGAAAAQLVARVRPAAVVHAAAERRPDAVEADVAASVQLNVDAVWVMGKAADAVGAVFLYISSDYLFDGTAAPYAEDAKPCPVNEYGRQKLRGEHAALAAHPSPIILRVPVLFGPTDNLAESAVTVFANHVRSHDKPQVLDDWQIRVPTYTPDVAATIENVMSRALDAAATPGQPKLTGIFHYSGTERFTRYALAQLLAELLGLPADHIKRDPRPPSGAPRPYDCQLDTAKLTALGLAHPPTPVRVALRAVLGLPAEPSA